MAMIKCKMCGGDLVLVEGQSVADCEYCGSRQTVPVADNEKKLTLFARANRLRASCEFDKAAGIYESIVADFPEEAEAYWGLVLCKYGIEYVDDPATGKKIPTCHRSSFDSIMDDANFEQALENADAVARKVYREEAKQIEEIRKGIIAVSSNEQPYDIFICYKETDENGERTLDSVLAQDIYDALTEKGYRTFFARITLEDKLGMEYEPYIFAALNSAKIMLAIGTDYEYYNAVWVKNEWSRYLKLMASDKTKHLIPCYKGIDAYDMPKEFARLQAQDLGKVGAMQDLLRGIEKILPKAAPVTVVQERVVVGGSGDNKIASLLDRGNMALEDGDWAKADSFFEDVLNNDSKNAQAYIGKTLAQEKCRTLDALIRKRKEATQENRTGKLSLERDTKHIEQAAQKYSIPGYVEPNSIWELYNFDLSYPSSVSHRKRQYQEEESWWENHRWMSRAEKFATGAVAENLRREKKALFAHLNEQVKKAEAAEKAAKDQARGEYEAFVAKTDEKARRLHREGLDRREQEYQYLLVEAKSETSIQNLDNTARALEAMGGYKDSKALAEHCRKRASDQRVRLNEEAEQRRIQAEKEEANRKTRKKVIALVAVVAVLIVMVALVVWDTVVIPANNYKMAEALLAEGKFEEAKASFEALNGYKDSVNKIEQCNIGIYGEELWNKNKNVNVGDIYTFGVYEQDNDISNGTEEIEWQVIAKEGTRVLVVSKYALDHQAYNTSNTDVTWGTCSLREWLNNDFLNAAFSEDEMAMIPTEQICLSGNITQDKIFLLSTEQAYVYLIDDDARQCSPTNYAVANGVYESDNGTCDWWLRSPGVDPNRAVCVSPDGTVSDFGRIVSANSSSVRPAMWIELSLD